MTFAIPTTEPTAIRCNAIIERLVNYRPGCFAYDNAIGHAETWIKTDEGLSHPHPFISFEGDAIIRALVENPENADWLPKGEKWLKQFDSARRQQHRPTICLPACRDTADLVAANID